MIDLHLHTVYSDGTLPPKEVVRLAKEKGVTTIAITDHDGTGGIAEAAEAGEHLGVQVIPGIELSAGSDEGFYMHILGYGIDISHTQLNEVIADIRQKRRERNAKLMAALREIDIDLTVADLPGKAGQDYIGKPDFARALMQKGYISTPKEAFAEGMFLRSPQVRAVHRTKIDIRQAIDLIHQAGGVAVLAHPLKISWPESERKDDYFTRLPRLLTRLKGYGLDGMECYYSKHLLYETERLVALAEQFALLITAGSDFHGPEFDAKLTVGNIPVDANFDQEKILRQLTAALSAVRQD